MRNVSRKSITRSNYCMMITYIILSAILYSIYRYLFHIPSLKSYKYPYSEPGIFYKLNYVFNRIYLLFCRKTWNRLRKYSIYGKSAVENAIMTSEEQSNFELHQKLSSKMMDELRMSGMNVENGSLLDISISRHQGGICKYWLYFVCTIDGKRRHYEIPYSKIIHQEENGANDLWVAKDLKIWCLEPIKRYRIFFNGFLRDMVTGEVDEVEFRFIWSPYTTDCDHIDCISDSLLADALAKTSEILPLQTINSILNQYDFWGSFYGQFSINGSNKQKLILRGNKTRHIGDFMWQNVNKYFDFKFYFEDGTVANINFVSLMSGTLPEMTWGYIEMPNDITYKITWTDINLPLIDNSENLPSILSFRLKTDGEEFVLNIKIDDVKIKCEWGPAKWPSLDFNIHRVEATLINLSQNLIRNGLGSFHHGTGRDYVTEVDLDSVKSKKVGAMKVGEDLGKNETILTFANPSCKDVALTGGKGSSLAMLTSLVDQRAQVPLGFCVTTTAHKQHQLQNEGIRQAIEGLIEACKGETDSSVVEASSAKVEEQIRGSEMSDELTRKVCETLEKLFGYDYESMRFAVRSSAIGEDGEEMSGAGQMETFLGCKGHQNICSSIIKCWASLYGFRAVEYRRQNGQVIDVRMSVVVQVMVDADTAGVMFTRHPMNGSPSQVLISANYGLGESVVSASCDPDSIEVKRSYKNELSVANVTPGKKKSKVLMTDDGVKTVNVDADETDKCCLTNDQIIELAKMGIYIEECYGSPRDIEWAISSGQIYLLQSRPITALDQMNDFELTNELNTAFKTDGDQINCGNVKEVMPGAMAPIWIHTSDVGFSISVLRLGRLLICPKKYNPYSSYAMCNKGYHRFLTRTVMNSQFKNKYATKEDIWLKDGFDIAINGRAIKDEQSIKADHLSFERFRYSPRMSIFLNKFDNTLNILNAKKRIVNMVKKFDKFQLEFDDCSSAEQLAHAIFNCTEPCIEVMQYHIQTSISSICMNSMIFIELMKMSNEITQKQYADFATLLSIEAQSENVESANIPNALQSLAEKIRTSISKEEFSNMTDVEAINWLTSEECHVKDDFENFLKRHGHRTIKEFDVASKTWDMEPTQLIAPLKAMINAEGLSKKKKLTIDDAMKNLMTKFSPKALKKLRADVLKARDFVVHREKSKSMIIKVTHEYRKQIIKLGKMMALEGRIPYPELIMWMTPYEIKVVSKTRSSSILQKAIRRLKLHPTLEKQTFPEFSYGYPEPIETTEAQFTIDESSTVKGIPVSQGIVVGTARTVLHLKDAGCIKPGDILVTSSTDIAWSPYFPSLGGVITELGGLISHGAVVAREYGIPCVVGAIGATSVIKSGDKIRLNGTTGLIEILLV